MKKAAVHKLCDRLTDDYIDLLAYAQKHVQHKGVFGNGFPLNMSTVKAIRRGNPKSDTLVMAARSLADAGYE